jgi:hypothetical protein
MRIHRRRSLSSTLCLYRFPNLSSYFNGLEFQQNHLSLRTFPGDLRALMQAQLDLSALALLLHLLPSVRPLALHLLALVHLALLLPLPSFPAPHRHLPPATLAAPLECPPVPLGLAGPSALPVDLLTPPPS